MTFETSVKSQRLSDFTGTRAQQGRSHGGTAPLKDSLKSFKDLSAPNQNRGGLTFGSGDNIEHPMHAITEIEIGTTTGAPHGCIAGRPAMSRVAGTILGPAIRFHLGDPERNALAREQLPKDRNCRELRGSCQVHGPCPPDSPG